MFEKYLPHLLELRQRAIRSCIVFAILLIPMFYYSAPFYRLVATPILNSLPHGSLLVATQVVTPFTTPLKLAFFSTILLIIPYLLYHVWAFIAPALYRHEKHALRTFMIASPFLFYLGVFFAHFLVLPMALHFFIHIAPTGITIMTDMTHYLDFILALYFAFGIAFQVPIVTMILILTKMVSIHTLKKNRPYIIVGAFILGMLLTPPDVISQILLAVPLLGLFEGGLVLAKYLVKEPKKVIQA